jgi:hypothetical protein
MANSNAPIGTRLEVIFIPINDAILAALILIKGKGECRRIVSVVNC